MLEQEYKQRLDLEAGKKVTWASVAVNAGLIIFKLVGGIYGQSRALLADALHSISDFISDILVLIGLHFFKKSADAEHPYGHGKIETLSTIGIGALLLAASIRIGVSAAIAIFKGTITAPHTYTIYIAAASIVSKEILYQFTIRIGKRLKSEAMVANAWHHRSDAWSSIVTIIGISLAVYVPSLRTLDSYAALLVSFFIMKIAVNILIDSIKKIIDTSPSKELMEAACRVIKSVAGVKGCHNITARYYADMISMEVHIVVDPMLTVLEAHRIADEVENQIKEHIGNVSSVLVHIDPYDDDSRKIG